jgi:hypothetical membrane protein
MKRYNIKKIAGICGILVPIVIFLCLWLSISGSPWFSWTHNALSDLGIGGIYAFIFNNGLILGGIFAFVFSIGLSKTLKNKLGAYLLAISSIALICTGLFPVNIFVLHYVSSSIFFISLTLALFIIGITLKETKFEHRLGITAIIFAIIACSAPLFLNVLKGIAVPEAIVCFPAFIWLLTYGIKLTADEYNFKFL